MHALHERATTRLSHGLFSDGLVEHLQQLRFVEDEFLPRHAGHFVVRREFDCIDGACFFAHAAINAAQFVDVELLGILFAIFPRALRRHDVNAIRRTRRRAHHACDATHATVFVLIESMHAAEIVAELPAIFDGSVIALLLRILQHPHVLANGTIASEVLKRMPHRRSETLEDVRDEQTFHPCERGGGDINQFVVANSHGVRDGRVSHG